MGNITRNISRHEGACKCGCGFAVMDFRTVEVVQGVCDHILGATGADRVILHINSWCRCEEHNKNEGGEDDSYHLTGMAVDFWIEIIKDEHRSIIDPHLVYVYLNRKYAGQFGIGKYKDFTHFDPRGGSPKRW